jgi:hypothetical protein
VRTRVKRRMANLPVTVMLQTNRFWQIASAPGVRRFTRADFLRMVVLRGCNTRGSQPSVAKPPASPQPKETGLIFLARAKTWDFQAKRPAIAYSGFNEYRLAIGR